MNLDELMQSIAEEYPHPYMESYKVGKEHGIELVGNAIHKALGYQALATVTAYLKDPTTLPETKLCRAEIEDRVDE